MWHILNHPLTRAAVACWHSEDACWLARHCRAINAPQLTSYWRTLAIVQHDRALRMIDGQPVRD